MSRDSVFSIATKLRAGRSAVQIPKRQRDFSLLKLSRLLWVERFFAGGKAARACC
jgi:hypothetical protein